MSSAWFSQPIFAQQKNWKKSAVNNYKAVKLMIFCKSFFFAQKNSYLSPDSNPSLHSCQNNFLVSLGISVDNEHTHSGSLVPEGFSYLP